MKEAAEKKIATEKKRVARAMAVREAAMKKRA